MVNTGTVDIHCHTAGAGYGGSGCFISQALRSSWRYGAYLRAFGVTQKELERYGDGVVLNRLSLLLAGSRRVRAAVVLAMDGVVGPDGTLDRSRTEMYIPNGFLAENVKRHGNLMFGASINPYRKDALERLDRAAEDGAVLVKWLPPIQGIDPADSRALPFYRKTAELGLPLLTHTGDEHSFTRADNRLADPARLRLALDTGVTVIAAHGATAGSNNGLSNLDALAGMFSIYPNLYADISSLTQINKPGHLARLLGHTEFHGRLLYGTDMPLISTPLVSPLYFPTRLSPRRMYRLSKIRNPWDADVMLKEALGVPEAVFANASKLLGIGAGKEGGDE